MNGSARAILAFSFLYIFIKFSIHNSWYSSTFLTELLTADITLLISVMRNCLDLLVTSSNLKHLCSNSPGIHGAPEIACNILGCFHFSGDRVNSFYYILKEDSKENKISPHHYNLVKKNK